MKLVWVTGLMTLSIKSALGLRCYTCNSHFDPLCGAPFFDDIGEVVMIHFADNDMDDIYTIGW